MVRLEAQTPSKNAFAEKMLSGYMTDPHIYHLKPIDEASNPFGDTKKKITPLFRDDVNFKILEEFFAHGARFKTTTLSEDYDWSVFLEKHPRDALPLFCISANGRVNVFNSKNPPAPKAGDSVIYIYSGPKMTVPPFPTPGEDGET